MKKGVTIMEMLFITAVMSIIAGIGIMMIDDSSQAAIQKGLETQKFSIIEKQKLYYDKYGTFFTVDEEVN